MVTIDRAFRRVSADRLLVDDGFPWGTIMVDEFDGRVGSQIDSHLAGAPAEPLARLAEPAALGGAGGLDDAY